MLTLALAHLLHRRLRTALCVLAVAIGIAMLVVMLAISHGMLNEVADRVQSVDADLIVLPDNENVIFTAGAAFSGRVKPVIDAFSFEGRPVVGRTIGVMLDTLHLGGQQQRLFAVDRDDMPAFLAGRRVVQGRLFDEGRAFGRRVDALRNDQGYYDPASISEEELLPACELVIDTRLARVGGYTVGEWVTFLGRPFRIVGIVESGVAGRVFCPLPVLQHIKNGGAPWVSLFFVKVRPPPPGSAWAAATRGAEYEEAVAEAMSQTLKAKVEPKSGYRRLMYEGFAQIYLYINLASGLALAVCFIIILLTMYTLVVERTREIGILKSLGAGRGQLVGQVVLEAVLICGVGTAVGLGLAVGAKFAIESWRPLLTLSIEPSFVGWATAIGVAGGGLSALYPGFRAARLDPVAALAVE